MTTLKHDNNNINTEPNDGAQQGFAGAKLNADCRPAHTIDVMPVLPYGIRERLPDIRLQGGHESEPLHLDYISLNMIHEQVAMADLELTAGLTASSFTFTNILFPEMYQPTFAHIYGANPSASAKMTEPLRHADIDGFISEGSIPCPTSPACKRYKPVPCIPAFQFGGIEDICETTATKNIAANKSNLEARRFLFVVFIYENKNVKTTRWGFCGCNDEDIPDIPS
ncbi:MAG: hypothetical protein LBH04_04620 [Tannerellaceae bacterium]|jgi:hypothetical protein|nr:hypothetical protein [Tannerellaceae bacterium]